MEDIKVARREVKDLVCVSLDVHLWSGRKRLRKEALIEKNPAFANLPPESLATLGAIKICDPEDLAPFARLKREAEKVLANSGLPLLGTWGVPQGKLERVYKRLKELQAEFDTSRSQLQRDYDTRIDDWRSKPENRAWQHLIAEIPTPEYVAGRLSFGFHMVRVLAPSSDDASGLNEGFTKQVGGLKGELFADAAREARVLMDKYLMGKGEGGVVSKRDKITHKTLRPLHRIAEKMRSFAFLDSTVEPMAEVIEHCLKLLPAEGPIEGVHLVHIWTLARTLANEHAAEEAAALATQLGSPGEAFENMLAKSQPATQVVAAPDPTIGVTGSPAPAATQHAPVQPQVAVPQLGELQSAFF
jgi:hypothetical protein